MQMDKSSIVGDAALYVQDLQMQAKRLKAEVLSLESSLTRMDRQQGGIHVNPDKFQIAHHYPTIRIILQVISTNYSVSYLRTVCEVTKGTLLKINLGGNADRCVSIGRKWILCKSSVQQRPWSCRITLQGS